MLDPHGGRRGRPRLTCDPAVRDCGRLRRNRLNWESRVRRYVVAHTVGPVPWAASFTDATADVSGEYTSQTAALGDAGYAVDGGRLPDRMRAFEATAKSDRDTAHDRYWSCGETRRRMAAYFGDRRLMRLEMPELVNGI